MFPVLLFSALLGLCWNTVAVWLLGGQMRDGLRPSWLLAGIVAGLVAGTFTVWSRKRRDGDESFAAGLATYYLGIVAYWLGIVVFERVRLCWSAGGWTDFDLADHLGLIAILLVHGTVVYGIVLIPACFLSRRVVWAIHCRTAG